MTLTSVLTYTLFPVAATLAGGVFAAFVEMSGRARSVVQHLAAGVVFAAAAAELLPDVVRRHEPLEVAAGFVLGVAGMLALRAFARRYEEGSGGAAGLIAATAVDVLVDGGLIGITFALGTREGTLIDIALSLEMLFLGLSAVTALQQPSRQRIIGTTALLSLLLLAGAMPGFLVANMLSGGALELLLSVGLVVLLYLVTEELLVEAHEVKETPLATAAFFLGFLALLLIDMKMG